MSDGTKIEWTDATWNVINGCMVVSPGCTNCYAMKQAHRFPVRQGLSKQSNGGMVWTGEVRFNEKVLLDPLRWKRPRKIFVCAHGDLFYEKVPDEWIDRVFAAMALAPQHTFQVLTKRPERMREYLTIKATERNRATAGYSLGRGGRVWEQAYSIAAHDLVREERFTEALRQQGMVTDDLPWPLPNVWCGTSVEDQARADERIGHLREVPAAVRWLSCEPLLGPVWLGDYVQQVHHHPDNRDRGSPAMLGLIKAARDHLGGGIDWVVAGGESGPGARPMHPDWARSLRDQCAAAGVAFHFKQWGAWLPGESLNVGPPWEPAKWQDGAEGRHPSCIGRPDDKCPEWRHFGTPGEPGAFALKVGKKAAGRLLDGVEHNGYPA